MSPLEAWLRTVDAQFSNAAFVDYMFHHGGAPDYMLIAKQGIGKEQKRAFRSEFRRLFGRMVNRKETVAILSGDADLKPLQRPPRELQSVEHEQQMVTNLAMAFGVPKSLLTSDDVNLANAREGSITHARNTIWPMVNRFEDVVNQRLLPKWSDRLFIMHDSPIQEDRSIRIQERASQLGAGYSINEIRTADGMPAIEDDRADEPMVAANLVPAMQDAAEVGSDASDKAWQIRKKYEDIDFTPPEGAREEARRGLEWRSEFGRGGTEVGIARARDISNGKDMSPDTIGRMVSFFARHEVDKEAEGFDPGEDGYPSNGRIAWALWGGDPGESWANKVKRQMDSEDEKSLDDVIVKEAQAEEEPDVVVDSFKGLLFQEGCSCELHKKATEDFGSASDGEGALADALEKAVRLFLRGVLKSINATLGKSFIKKDRPLVPMDSVLFFEEVDFEGVSELLGEVTEDQIATLMFKGGSDALMQLEQQYGFAGGVAFDINTDAAQNYLRTTKRRMTKDLPQTLEKDVRKTVASHISAGDSVAVMAQTINERLSTKAGNWSESRAKRIARTESRFAAEAGKREGWEQSGVVVGKEFEFAPGGCKVCQAFDKAVAGKVFPINGVMYGKGTSLEYTDESDRKRQFHFDYTDVQGPPIHPNCRCTLVPKVADD